MWKQWGITAKRDRKHSVSFVMREKEEKIEYHTINGRSGALPDERNRRPEEIPEEFLMGDVKPQPTRKKRVKRKKRRCFSRAGRKR